MKRRGWLCLFLALCISLAMIPAVVFAETPAKSEDGEKALTVGCTDGSNVYDWYFDSEDVVLHFDRPLGAVTLIDHAYRFDTRPGEKVDFTLSVDGKTLTISKQEILDCVFRDSPYAHFDLMIHEEDGRKTVVRVNPYRWVTFVTPVEGKEPNPVRVLIENSTGTLPLPGITEDMFVPEGEICPYDMETSDLCWVNENGSECGMAGGSGIIYAEGPAVLYVSTTLRRKMVYEGNKNYLMTMNGNAVYTWTQKDTEPLEIRFPAAVTLNETEPVYLSYGKDQHIPMTSSDYTMSEDGKTFSFQPEFLNTIDLDFGAEGQLLFDDESYVGFFLITIPADTSLSEMTMEEGTATEPLKWTIGLEESELGWDFHTENFVGLKVNGETVPEEYYSIEDGCIVVSLSEDYLNRLEPGTYHLTAEVQPAGMLSVLGNLPAQTTLTVTSSENETEPENPGGTDGAGEAGGQAGNGGTSGMTIKPVGTTDGTGANTQPNTGDNSRAELWLMLGGIAAAVCIGMMARKRKVQ